MKETGEKDMEKRPTRISEVEKAENENVKPVADINAKVVEKASEA